MKKIPVILSSGVKLGAEIIVNGTFDTDLTGWIVPDGGVLWDASFGGSAIFNNTGVNERLRQITTAEIAKTYQLKFDIKDTGGGLVFQYNMGSYTSVGVVEAKTYTFEVTPTNINLYFRCNTQPSNIIIDNVSLKEIL